MGDPGILAWLWHAWTAGVDMPQPCANSEPAASGASSVLGLDACAGSTTQRLAPTLTAIAERLGLPDAVLQMLHAEIALQQLEQLRAHERSAKPLSGPGSAQASSRSKPGATTLHSTPAAAKEVNTQAVLTRSQASARVDLRCLWHPELPSYTHRGLQFDLTCSAPPETEDEDRLLDQLQRVRSGAFVPCWDVRHPAVALCLIAAHNPHIRKLATLGLPVCAAPVLAAILLRTRALTPSVHPPCLTTLTLEQHTLPIGVMLSEVLTDTAQATPGKDSQQHLGRSNARSVPLDAAQQTGCSRRGARGKGNLQHTDSALVLQGDRLGAAEAAFLAALLPQCLGVHALLVEAPLSLPDAVCAALHPALTRMPGLLSIQGVPMARYRVNTDARLDLNRGSGGTALGFPGAVFVAASLLDPAQAPAAIDLTGTEIGEAGSVVVAEAFVARPCDRLMELLLGNTLPGLQGSVSWCAALQTGRLLQLCVLDLRFNGLDDTQLVSLLPGVAACSGALSFQGFRHSSLAPRTLGLMGPGFDGCLEMWQHRLLPAVTVQASTLHIK